MEELQKVLSNATSVNLEIRTIAMNTLQLWELEPNYHSALQQIYLNSKNDAKIRHLAIISLKNGIGKYWRKSAKGAIQPQEKILIKKNQLEYLSEPNGQLAATQAVVTSKIARFDFPNEWPELLDRLIPIVQSSFNSSDTSNYALRYNSLYTLHLSMKAVTSKTLPMARKLTQKITPDVFKYVSSLYSSQISLLFSMLSQGGQVVSSEAHIQHISIIKVSLKCLRRLVINGYVYFSQNQEVVDLFNLLSQHYPQFISLKRSLAGQVTPFSKLVDSIVVLVGKLMLDASQDRVIDFIICPSSMQVCKYIWTLLESPQTQGPVDEVMVNIHIQAIKLFKNLVSHREFTTITAKDKDPRLDAALLRLQSELFLPDFVLHAAKLLISHYMPLDAESLDLWNDEPEDFLNEADSDQWEFNRRGCAEKLLMVLVSRNKSTLCHMLVQTLQSLVPLHSGSTKEAILFKDAMYCAIGINSHELIGYLEFDDWLCNSLVSESKVVVEGSNIIKRRIALVISNWVGVKSRKENRRIIYEILLFYLQNRDDVVVGLTAVSALQVVLDDFDFEAAVFTPFLVHFTSCFMSLIGEVDEFDSKIKIINCLVVVIERMEGQILPFISPLLQILPELWLRSEGQNLFRASIVTIISKLVKTLRHESFQLASMVLPILHSSLDTSNPGHLHLFEEGLDLWLASLQNATSCSNELLSLIPTAISFLEIGNENLKKILHILEAYIVLAPLDTLQRYADPLFTGIATKLGTFTAEASNSILRLVDLTLQSCQTASCFPALFQMLVSKGLLARMLQVVIGGDELNVIVIGLLMVLHRVGIYDASSFLNVVIQQGGDAALNRYLDIILDKYDALGHLRQRKMFALGLIAMTGTGHPIVMSKLLGVCTILTSGFSEVSNIDQQKEFSFETSDGDEDKDSLDYQRRKGLHQHDLLFNHQSFKPFLSSKFQESQKITGVDLLLNIAQSDQEIAVQMQRLLN